MQSHADLICRSQTSHTPPHTLRTSLASRPIRRPVSGNQSAGKPVINGSAFEGRPREPICRGRGAGVGTRARRGRGHARPRGAPRGGHARGGGGGSRERDWEARGVAPAARARSARSAQLGDDEGDHAARSASRGQEPTPSSPPGRRIETSLRRKGVRGGGSGRACGAKAKAVRGGGSRRASACGAPVCPRQGGSGRCTGRAGLTRNA